MIIMLGTRCNVFNSMQRERIGSVQIADLNYESVLLNPNSDGACL